MTGFELANFYELDDKRYILHRNDGFVKTYCDYDMNPIIKLNEMQNLNITFDVF